MSCRFSAAEGTEATLISNSSGPNGQPHQHHMDHVSEQGCTSEFHYGVVRTPISGKDAMEKPEDTDVVDKEVDSSVGLDPRISSSFLSHLHQGVLCRRWRRPLRGAGPNMEPGTSGPNVAGRSLATFCHQHHGSPCSGCRCVWVMVFHCCSNRVLCVFQNFDFLTHGVRGGGGGERCATVAVGGHIGWDGLGRCLALQLVKRQIRERRPTRFLAPTLGKSGTTFNAFFSRSWIRGFRQRGREKGSKELTIVLRRVFRFRFLDCDVFQRFQLYVLARESFYHFHISTAALEVEIC